MIIDAPVLEVRSGFGLYVHWPFCAAKCPYCDFNSHVRHGDVDQQRYAGAFARELQHMAELAPERIVTSIFFGGGTPSLMLPETIETILNAAAKHWTIAADAEITLEANPSSVEAGHFRDYHRAGINRVSLGVQSLDDSQLKFLGRLHNAQEARAAISLANEVFSRVSFDMIYARPDQSTAEWERELTEALLLVTGHMSLYQLTIEAGTPFFGLQQKGKLIAPDAERAATLFEVTQQIMTDVGFPAYEVSNHAAPGQESLHNLTYWRYGEYVGIGPGAHGRLVIEGKRHAIAIEKYPETWLENVEANGHGICTDDGLTCDEQGNEMLLMGMRLKEGFDIGRFEAVSGRVLDSTRISSMIDLGYVEWMSNNRLRATARGWLVLNAVIAELAA